MPDVVVGRVPFNEAIDHFKNKKLVPTRYWDEMIGFQHAKAFTIAGATDIDMLNDFKKSIDDIRARGGTLADFRKDFDRIVAQYGWDYHGDRSWRTKLIFETNMRTSNATGRWAQIERRQAALKRRDPNATLYLQYRVLDHTANRRPLHQTWDGIILPVDHPWWSTHYPPNDYGCACSIRVLTQRALDKGNLKVTEDPPTGKLIERVNRRTGEIYPPTPEGIGVGWDHNHGRAAYMPSGANIVDARLGSKLAQITVDSDDFERFVKSKIEGQALVGFLPDGLKEAIEAKTSRIFLSHETMEKQRKRHSGLKVSDYKLLPKVLEKGLVIKDGSQTHIFIHIGKKVYRASVKSTMKGEELYLISFTKIDQKEIRRMRKKGEVIREQL